MPCMVGVFCLPILTLLCHVITKSAHSREETPPTGPGHLPQDAQILDKKLDSEEECEGHDGGSLLGGLTPTFRGHFFQDSLIVHEEEFLSCGDRARKRAHKSDGEWGPTGTRGQSVLSTSLTNIAG
ncbi:hypothetical protein FKM82_023705 [Ascaphus truei]